MSDENFMNMCFDLARNSWGQVSPNPYVGAVLVKDGRIIGKGFHKGPGHDHAEIDAIKNASEPVEGATLYCNLEPCCHTEKRTPPCAQRLIKEKIKKVVISNLDPNPQVAGLGVQLLKEAGIEVETGEMEEEGKELNEVFFKHIQTAMPFVHLKWAQTLDGKIATTTGSSKWITSMQARAKVHRERLAHDAILVGAGTLKMDNPSLTIREGDEVIKQAKRVVLASKDDFDSGLKFFSDTFKDQSLLLLPEGESSNKAVASLRCPPGADGRVDLKEALKKLHAAGIMSVYVEGGGQILTQFFREKLYDRLSVFMAPKILGEGMAPIGALNIEDINQAVLLKSPKVEMLGDNIYITAKGASCSQD